MKLAMDILVKKGHQSPLSQQFGRPGLLIFGVYGGAVLLAIIVAIVSGYSILNALPTPLKTLQAFCTALQHQDFGMAYNQLDANTQSIVNPVEFTQYASNNGGLGAITECSVTDATITGATGKGAITYSYSQGGKRSASYTLSSDANGFWRISNFPVSTPATVLNAYCSALKNRDYAAAYNLVADSVKAQESEGDFASKTKSFLEAGGGGIANCTVSNINNAGVDATGTITFVSMQKRTAIIDYALVLENGLWKLSSEQPRQQG